MKFFLVYIVLIYIVHICLTTPLSTLKSRVCQPHQNWKSSKLWKKKRKKKRKDGESKKETKKKKKGKVHLMHFWTIYELF